LELQTCFNKGYLKQRQSLKAKAKATAAFNRNLQHASFYPEM